VLVQKLTCDHAYDYKCIGLQGIHISFTFHSHFGAVVLLLAVHDISKRKKVTSTECLSVDVRLEVSVEVKPFTYDVT